MESQPYLCQALCFVWGGFSLYLYEYMNKMVLERGDGERLIYFAMRFMTTIAGNPKFHDDDTHRMNMKEYKEMKKNKEGTTLQLQLH